MYVIAFILVMVFSISMYYGIQVGEFIFKDFEVQSTLDDQS